MGFKDRHMSSRSEAEDELKTAMYLPKKNTLLDESAHQNYDESLSDSCCWPPATYFLISSVGENIQYQHGSSLGVSIFPGNRLHFIKVQWHFEFSILDTE